VDVHTLSVTKHCRTAITAPCCTGGDTLISDQLTSVVRDNRTATPPMVRLSLMGIFRLEWEGRAVAVPRHLQRVLAFLALGGGRVRASVAGTLWSDVPEHRALASLRTSLWRLSRLCPRSVVAAEDTVYLAESSEVDVTAFMATARGVTDGSSAPSDAPVDADLLSRELLPGWYEDWVLDERERLHQIGMHALECLAGRLLRNGRYDAALETALRVVSASPLRESAHRLVVQVHLAEGNVAEARRQYACCSRLLHTELGMVPAFEIGQLIPTAGVIL
jgi:DNA-binding SARP family transcriptional activator